MKDEARTWLKYADENLTSAGILLDHGLFNPCLQSVQQAVEKMLKALLIESGVKFRKTHSIVELIEALARVGVRLAMAEEEADMLDSIYLPSKYPLGSALPDFEPDRDLCVRCIDIGSRLRKSLEEWIGGV